MLKRLIFKQNIKEKEKKTNVILNVMHVFTRQ